MPLGTQQRADDYFRNQQVYYKGDGDGWCGGEVIRERLGL